MAGVHQHEASGAVGVLHIARLQAGLPEQGGLLVTRHAADLHRRSATPQQPGLHLTKFRHRG
jgi:hypothetical protein